MRLVAERNCEDLSRELIGCKDKMQILQNQLDVLRSEHQALQVVVSRFFSKTLDFFNDYIFVNRSRFSFRMKEVLARVDSTN